MTLPAIVLRGDLTGTAFGTAPTYTDYTAYLELGADGAPVDITWGRQDNRADVPPGTFSFLLNNTDGRFTVGGSIIDCDNLFNVQVTANAVTTDRVTGPVVSVEPTWPGGQQSWSIVRVTCADVLAPLAAAKPLRSMLEQEMLLNNPPYLYPLSEAAGSVSAGNVGSGAGNALTIAASKYGAGDVTFGTGTGVPTDGTSALQMNTTLTNLTADDLKGNRLEGLIGPVSSSLFTVEAWFVASTTLTAPLTRYPQPNYTPLALVVNGAGGFCFALGISYASSKIQPVLVTQDNAAGLTVTYGGAIQTAVSDGLLHHVLATNDSTGNATLYVDGVQVMNVAAVFPAGGALTSGKLIIGQRMFNGLPASPAFRGTIQDVGVYNVAVSAAGALARYQAGVNTPERSDQRFTRIAGYGKVTVTGLPTGQAIMGKQATIGRTVLDVLTEVARTEGSVPHPTGAGSLTFDRRDKRYNAAVTLTLTGPDIAPDLPIRKDKQDFYNELTVTRTGGATQVALNATSQAGKAGRVDGGSFNVAPSTDADAFQNASWQVGAHSPTAVSRTRFPSLKVDLLTRTAAFQATVLARTMSDLVQVTTLPSQAPIAAPYLFIEGGHEVIGTNEWYVEFFTSPQTIESQVWTLDSATSNGALDGTAVLAF